MTGEEIRAWRKKYGRSQQWLARKLAISQSYLSLMETEERVIPGWVQPLIEVIDDDIKKRRQA